MPPTRVRYGCPRRIQLAVNIIYWVATWRVERARSADGVCNRDYQWNRVIGLSVAPGSMTYGIIVSAHGLVQKL